MGYLLCNVELKRHGKKINSNFITFWVHSAAISDKRLVEAGVSKATSAFRPSEVDQMSTGNSRDLVLKSKLSLRSGSIVLRQLNPIHKSGQNGFFK